MQLTNEQLKEKAISLLMTYDEILTTTETAGNIMDSVLQVCKQEYEIDSYGKYSTLIMFLKVVAKPKVHRVLLEEMNETLLTNFIEILGDLIHFFQDMSTTHFTTKLQIVDLTDCYDNYGKKDIEYIINETERKMKSTRNRNVALSTI